MPLPHHHRHCHHCEGELHSGNVDYYWRVYNGKVPHDAVPGGRDADGNTTYVGQAFLSDVGILTGTLYPGEHTLKLPHNQEAKTSDVAVKILCGNDLDRFEWIDADSHNMHHVTEGKHVVIGGAEHDKDSNIGRVEHHGELIVGKVNGFYDDNVKMYYVHGDGEKSTKEYQVLVYKPSCC